MILLILIKIICLGIIFIKYTIDIVKNTNILYKKKLHCHSTSHIYLSRLKNATKIIFSFELEEKIKIKHSCYDKKKKKWK